MSTVSRKKRRRIRKRKPKKVTEKLPVNYGIIIDNKKNWSAVKSEVPPKPKHMKFNWDDGEVEIKNNKTSNLSNLLSLKDSPVPTVFTGKKLQKVEKVMDKNSESTKDRQIPNNEEVYKTREKLLLNFSQKTNPLDYPINKSVFQADDFIAFRVSVFLYI